MDHDYIVVGGGSAGCLAAWRLVREHGAKVLLLEAGYEDRNPLFRMPAGFFKMLGGSKYLSIYESGPQPQLGGRTTKVPQAHVLGGGSSINAMVYMRGKPAEYDEWDAATGAAGIWNWNTMLAHFIRLEGNERFGSPDHGTDGPLKVSDHRYASDMAYIYLQTMQTMGVPYRADFNAGQQHGVGFMQLTTDHARRCSATDAFLNEIRHDSKLTLRTRTTATRVLFEGGRAKGIEYASGRQLRKAYANNEVILAAGSFVTPKLLMLSGIGPGDMLRQHGIKTLVESPGVGKNLQDHHEVPVSAYTNGPYGYHGQDAGVRMIVNGIQYLLFRTGPVASNGAETCAFVNPVTRGDDTSVKIYCVPQIYLDRDVAAVRPDHGVTFTSCVMRPKARGSVWLRSADPGDQVCINPNFLGHPEDLEKEIAAIGFAREIIATQPMKKAIRAEVLPGPDIRSDDDLATYCRRTVKTNYHPVGTCRMGSEQDPQAVLLPDLQVKGTEGLRVFDASAMPNICSANTNGPTMALADRGVTLMLGEDFP